MNPTQQKAEDRIRKIYQQLETIDKFLNYIIVVVFILSALQFAIDYANVETIHTLHIAAACVVTLKLILMTYLGFLKLLWNKYFWLPGTVSVLTNNTMLKTVAVIGNKITIKNGITYRWNYLQTPEDIKTVCDFDIEMGNSGNLMYRYHQYEDFNKQIKGHTAALYSNNTLMASVSALPQKNAKHFNNLGVSFDPENAAERSNIICLTNMTIDYHYLDAVAISAWMALFCNHIATLACTHDGTHTDILIYARIHHQQTVFRKVLKAMGFVEINRVGDETTYTLRFNDQAANVYVRKIFDMMLKNEN